jgi:hypothetical protein
MRRLATIGFLCVRNGDREPGRFSRLPVNRCALEVPSTTSCTYEFLLRTHRCVAVASRLLVPPFSGRSQKKSQGHLAAKQLPCLFSNARYRRCLGTAVFRGIRAENENFAALNKLRDFEHACRLLRQTCPKLAKSYVDGSLADCHDTRRRLQGRAIEQPFVALS